MSSIVIANFYPVYPVGHGGQRRIFYLSRELARDHEVTLVTMTRGGSARFLKLAPGLTEVQVPSGRKYASFERALHSDVPMTADVAYAMRWRDCRLYQSVLKQHMRECQLAVSEHPYSFTPLLEATPRNRKIPLIYNSQNVESRQKAPVLDGRDDLLKVVRSVESIAVNQSCSIIACSEIDQEHFVGDYSTPKSKITIVENGVDVKGVPEITLDQVRELRRHLQLEGKFVVVFGGSYHFPNLAAADAILQFARSLPDIIFLILGSICHYSRLSGSLPANVLSLGTVSESEKWLSFGVSNLALNPMTHGSGSNIKMFEYAAAGLPTLSTNFGARATGLEAGQHYFEAEIEDFPAKLMRLSETEPQQLLDMGRSAKDFVAKRADWSVIGERYRRLVASVLENR